MKAIILSDTHSKSPEKLYWLQHTEADYIFHAGDYTELSVLTFLQSLNNFFGVSGNADCEQVKQMLPAKAILELANCRIGLFHGDGAGKTTPDRAFQAFTDDSVNIIIFGHSHQPSISTRNRILMLNPGSITNKRKEKWFSYIELEHTHNGIAARLCFS